MFFPEPERDDFFAGTRMSLGEHIEDLRRHLLRALAGFVVALCVGFYVCPEVLKIISDPVERELMQFYQRRQDNLARRLAEGDPQLTEADREREIEILIPADRLRSLLGLPADESGVWETLPIRVRPLQLALATGEATRLVGRPPKLASF